MKSAPSLPYGTVDLESDVQSVESSPRRVKCYVRGCNRILRCPTRGNRGEVCPEHGIRCHWSLGGSTYSYRAPERNIIACRDDFRTRIIGHPFKYESHRLGQENSEDALTWNVFRSLQEAGELSEVARWITGLDLHAEPILFLWGINTTDFKPWDLLIKARNRFETNLPVERPLTEPDIALFLSGQYLVLIEAKFTSPNTFYATGPRGNASSLTKDELLDIYYDIDLGILDEAKARDADRVYYQLWRNMIFAEWMAREDSKSTRAFHASLTRVGFEQESCEHFRGMVRPEFRTRFVHITWEDLYWQCARETSALGRLRHYLETKTTRLKRAFNLRQD